MKVLLINTLPRGGAARAAINLHLGLLEQGIESKMLFQYEDGNIPDAASYWSFHEKVIFNELQQRSFLSKIKDKVNNLLGFGLYTKYLKNRKILNEIEEKRDKGFEVFSSPWTLNEITKHPLYIEADIIHFHWVNNFVDYKEFFNKNTKPLFWTLHEMFPFTGGCSFSMGCRQFETSCKECPQLANTDHATYVDTLFSYKQKALANNQSPINIVAPSRWLADNSSKSKLFGEYPHHVIPYSMQHEFFNIGLRIMAKKSLGIEENKIVALFVSDNVANERKGTKYIFPLVLALSEKEGFKELLFITVGGGDLDLGKQHQHLGLIKTVAEMASIYAAADIFICPSLEDNFPNTILESLLVGTPVIGFPSGGIPEMIEDGINGLVVPEISSEALSNTILNWFATKDSFDHEKIASTALSKYRLDVQAKKMIELYKTVLT